MYKDELFIAMKGYLDKCVKEYQQYTDETVKQSIIDEFEIEVRSFNNLLHLLHPNVTIDEFFSRHIEGYILDRNRENWK